MTECSNAIKHLVVCQDSGLNNNQSKHIALNQFLWIKFRHICSTTQSAEWSNNFILCFLCFVLFYPWDITINSQNKVDKITNGIQIKGVQSPNPEVFVGQWKKWQLLFIILFLFFINLKCQGNRYYSCNIKPESLVKIQPDSFLHKCQIFNVTLFNVNNLYVV